jgi:hypothetical protein
MVSFKLKPKPKLYLTVLKLTVASLVSLNHGVHHRHAADHHAHLTVGMKVSPNSRQTLGYTPEKYQHESLDWSSRPSMTIDDAFSFRDTN